MQTLYYLTKFDAFEVKKEFANLVGHLRGFTDIVVEKEAEQSIQAKIRGATQSFVVSYSSESDMPLKEKPPVFLIECEVADMGAMNLLRHVGAEFGYRMFSVEQGGFLPQDPQLFPVNTGLLTEKATKVFKLYDLTPIFGYGDKARYYAKDAKEQVHIINPALLNYCVAFGAEKTEAPAELSYVVAENLNQFVAMHDMSLVPEHFYDYFQRNMTIFNYSGMDIWKVKRKIFIKPYLFDYQPDRTTYELVTSDKAVMNFADKIRPGENLKMAVERVLKEEFKITQPYQKMRVSRKVEFDRDKDNILTPRLNVAIFFEQISLGAEVVQQTKRGWSSLDRVVN